MEYTIHPQLDNFDVCCLSNKDLEVYNLKCVNDSKEFPNDFVCFNFAFNDYNIESCEEALLELECNYNQIDIEKAIKGDIISYHEDTGMICRNRKPIYRPNHFAIINETDGTIRGTIIKSKWGTDKVFQGRINNIPEYYGEIIAIWNKK